MHDKELPVPISVSSGGYQIVPRQVSKIIHAGKYLRLQSKATIVVSAGEMMYLSCIAIKTERVSMVNIFKKKASWKHKTPMGYANSHRMASV
jgi:hypothetical protein